MYVVRGFKSSWMWCCVAGSVESKVLMKVYVSFICRVAQSINLWTDYPWVWGKCDVPGVRKHPPWDTASYQRRFEILSDPAVRTSDPIMYVNLSMFLYYLDRGSRIHIVIIAVNVDLPLWVLSTRVTHCCTLNCQKVVSDSCLCCSPVGIVFM